MVKEIIKRRLMWAGNAYRKQRLLVVRQVIEKDTIGKRSLGRPRLRWEDCVKEDIKKIGPDIRRKEAAQDKGKWQGLYLIYIRYGI